MVRIKVAFQRSLELRDGGEGLAVDVKELSAMARRGNINAAAAFRNAGADLSYGALPLRFTKLPKMATSSLLLRVWKSFQLKSLSLVSGALAVST